MRNLQTVEVGQVSGGTFELEYGDGDGDSSLICSFTVSNDPSGTVYECTFGDNSVLSFGADDFLSAAAFGGGVLASIGRMIGRGVTSGASDEGYAGSLAGLEGWGATVGP